jgi:hypothetical protein
MISLLQSMNRNRPNFLADRAEVEAVEKSYLESALKNFVTLYPKDPQTGAFFQSFQATSVIREMAYDIIQLKRQLKEKLGD